MQVSGISGRDEWSIKPPLTNSSFSEYKVSLTPASKVIYKIIATRPHQPMSQSEFLSLCDILRKKYSPDQSPPDQFESPYIIIQRHRSIKIEANAIGDAGSRIEYFDESLAEVADAEQNKIDRSKTESDSKKQDASGL